MRKVWLNMAVVAVAAVAIVAGSSVVKSVAAQGDVKEVTVAAKKFDFTPADIHVKAGQHVRLIVTATDRDHGIEVNPYADGSDKKGEPGLKFDANPKKPEFKLPKDQAVTVEFVAAQPGTYTFKCSVFCGMGHRDMKGQITVEP